MAIPNQTLELTNSNQMPPTFGLTGDELFPAAENLTTKLPISVTSVRLGDYVLGKYTFNLTNYLDNVNNVLTPLSELLMYDNGQTYKIEISALSDLIAPNIILTGSGLAYVTQISDHEWNTNVPIATVPECDEAIRNDVAVTPLGLSHYKDRLDELEAEMAALLYKPVDITSFTATPSIVEIGQSVAVTSLNWAINKTITSQTINPGNLHPQFDNRSIAVGGPISTDYTWTLTATDGSSYPGNTDTATASLVFRNKRYWGVSPNTTLTNSQIIALSSEFATSRVKDVIYDATGGRYVYYAYPVSFGNFTAVKVGGLAFSDYTVTVITFTNASGYISQYNLVRINNIQTGANIQVHWE